MDTDVAAALSRFPHHFTDRRDRCLKIVALDEALSQCLTAMYLAYRPRDSFQGLPPLKDEACRRWVQAIVRDGIHLVATAADGDVVGHAALFPLAADRCEFLLVVSPEYQGHGVGMELARSAMQLARDLGLDIVRLAVDGHNARARRLYRKFGFRYRSQPGRDEIEMSLDLSSFPGEILVGPRTAARAGFPVGD